MIQQPFDTEPTTPHDLLTLALPTNHPATKQRSAEIRGSVIFLRNRIVY
jgi:hypothetical protein